MVNFTGVYYEIKIDKNGHPHTGNLPTGTLRPPDSRPGLYIKSLLTRFILGVCIYRGEVGFREYERVNPG